MPIRPSRREHPTDPDALLRNGRGSGAVLPTGIILSAIVVCILLFTGWKGWELVYRHHVGVSELP